MPKPVPNYVHGGKGDDQLTGTAGEDIFLLGKGGNDTAKGLGGDDQFRFGGSFNAGDTVNGGSGTDVVWLDGNYADGITLGADTLTDVERIAIKGGHAYDLTLNDGNTAAGGKLAVDGRQIGPNGSLTVDGSAETDGHLHIFGSHGQDDLTGGHLSDVFWINSDGMEDAAGGGGGDTFHLGVGLTAKDHINGGQGNDTLWIGGEVTPKINLGGLVSIENIKLHVNGGTDPYDLVTTDSLIGNGGTLDFDASHATIVKNALPHGHVATIPVPPAVVLDARGETDGFINFTGSNGNDRVMISHANVLGGSTIDGGGGFDQLVLDGDFSSPFVFGPNTITNMEGVAVLDGHDYDLTLDANSVTGSNSFAADASALGASHHLKIDVSAASIDGQYDFASGLGGDTFILVSGQQSSQLASFTFASVATSTSTGFDTIRGLDFVNDTLYLPTAASWQSPDGNSGSVSSGTFDADIASAADATHLTAGHACLVAVDGGTFDGETFLVIDQNGTAGYQANQDIVIDITGFTGLF